ncbi:response regulator transcription factor [Maribacter halichondriae]|uniref:response regulator transcription factor n=1 Tax=Maribacter halichondriae TaxID=2980554 RepID=UPI0023583AB2|nr:response regulator transcription factor [Maribacter sp. Hal144]
MRAKKRILIVEDDEMVITLLKILLEKEGFQLVVARDGNKGAEAVQNIKPDLILMDIMLPYKSGMEVISIAKKKYKEIPIIVLSALGQVEQTIDEAMRIGVADVIAKPFVVDKLLSRIRTLLKK